MGSDKPDYTLGINILAQELANLTAVVTASALDIRALNSSDIAHVALPYNFIPLRWLTEDAIADSASDSKTWTQADWGTGKDFYVISIAYRIWILSAKANNAYVKFYQGFRFELQEIKAQPPHPMVDQFNVNPMSNPPVIDTATFTVSGTRLCNNNKVESGNNLRLMLYNECGTEIGVLAMDAYVLGMAV